MTTICIVYIKTLSVHRHWIVKNDKGGFIIYLAGCRIHKPLFLLLVYLSYCATLYNKSFSEHVCFRRWHNKIDTHASLFIIDTPNTLLESQRYAFRLVTILIFIEKSYDTQTFLENPITSMNSSPPK